MKRFKILLALVVLLGACPERAERRHATADPPLTELWLWQAQVNAAKLVVEPLFPQPVGGLVIPTPDRAWDAAGPGERRQGGGPAAIPATRRRSGHHQRGGDLRRFEVR